MPLLCSPQALGETNPMRVDIPTASVSIIDYPDGFLGADGFAAGDGPSPIVRSAGVKPPLGPEDEVVVGDLVL